MPVRRIRKSHRNLTGAIASKRNGRLVRYESPLERDLMAVLEFAREVKRYEEQPLTLSWRGPGTCVQTYTPDLLIEFAPRSVFLGRAADRPWLVEVKPRQELMEDREALVPRFKAGVTLCRERGWYFRVLTEEQIRTPFLQNARFLRQFRRHEYRNQDLNLIVAALRHRPRSVRDLLFGIGGEGCKRDELLSAIWHLLSAHQLKADLTRAISMDSWLEVDEESFAAANYDPWRE